MADDSLTIQKVVELTFMEGDYEVSAVSNGDEALSKLSEMTPDVVIADVHMPGADGFEICRATKQRHPGVPVLLLVGTFEPFEDSAAQDAGADSHLKKPFDSQELLRLVEDLLSVAGGQVPGGLEEPETIDTDDFGDDLGGVFGAGQSLESEAAVVAEPPVDMAAGEQGEETFPEELVVEESTGAEIAGLSDDDVDRIARRVVQLMSDQTVREISWDVIPDLAEILIKDRIRELESQLD